MIRREEAIGIMFIFLTPAKILRDQRALWVALLLQMGTSVMGRPLPPPPTESITVRVASKGPVSCVSAQVTTYVPGSMSMDSAMTGPAPGQEIRIQGRVPLAWDTRPPHNQFNDDLRTSDATFVASLLIEGVRPIPIHVAWLNPKGVFQVEIPVNYPPTVDRAEIVFRRGVKHSVVGQWSLSHLPRTADVVTATKAKESSRLPVGLRVEAIAYRHHSPNWNDDPDEVVVGARLDGPGADSAVMKDIHLELPFVCRGGGKSGASMGLDGARSFLTSLPSYFADGTDAVRFEATVLTARSQEKTLKVGKVLLQKSARGLTVAGKQWSTTIDGFSVFVREPQQSEPKAAPGTVKLEVGIRPVADDGAWFEFALDNHRYAGREDVVDINLPVPAGQREVDLTLNGRVVSTGQSTKVVLRVPVRGTKSPVHFPPYKDGLQTEPYLEGSLGGYSYWGPPN